MSLRLAKAHAFPGRQRWLFIVALALGGPGCLSAEPNAGGRDATAPTGSGGADESRGASGGAAPTGDGSGGAHPGSGGVGGAPGSGGQPASGSGGAPAGGSGGAVDPNDPLNQHVSCTSGKQSRGTFTDTMAPGRPCLDCHGGFAVAGTVYPTGHEVNDCQGASDATVQIVITDANGYEAALPINSVGNFAASGYLPTPFTAKIVRGTVERRMKTPQTNSNCNDCHTADGAQGAPGRIVPPLDLPAM